MDEIVNTFLLKMQRTIEEKVGRHEDELARRVLGTPVPSRILEHILADKFTRSSIATVACAELTRPMVEELLRHIVQQKCAAASFPLLVSPLPLTTVRTVHLNEILTGQLKESGAFHWTGSNSASRPVMSTMISFASCPGNR
jgi:hypothetical protein|eukprot:COSAG02_NODE_1285_length_13457_cov_11.145606_7_plen_142_part_00